MTFLRNKSKQGFTLVEMMVSVSVMTALCAVSIPNLMRMKMSGNMEAVRQNMRTVGEKVTEIMGTQKQLPTAEEWGNGVTEDELSLTANLSAIDMRQYTIDDYTPNVNAGYEFVSCPRDGLWGTAGDRCFMLDPLGVHELPIWQGYWSGKNVWNNFSFSDYLRGMMDADVPYPQKLEQFSLLMQDSALLASYWMNNVGGCVGQMWGNSDTHGGNTGIYENMKYLAPPGLMIMITAIVQVVVDYLFPRQDLDKLTEKPGDSGSSYYIVDGAQTELFQQLLKDSSPGLKEQGITILSREQTVEKMTKNCSDACDKMEVGLSQATDPKIFELAFTIDEPVLSASELSERRPKDQPWQKVITCIKGKTC